jgi:hypothetical protein
MPLRRYDGTVIDPFWVDLAGRDEATFPSGFYRACCRASPVFQLGDWRRRRREAEARNDFRALDALDQEYERIGM